MNATRAVLWDMDGTLVDSEELHWLSWRDTMAAEGIQITRGQFLASFGKRNDSVLPGWLASGSTPERVEKLSTSKDAPYRDLVRANGISALPGVSRWVSQLHQDGWMQAIASSAPRLNVEVVLEVLGFSSRFQSIVSAEDVKRGKPDP
jgi:beta-phosphoglucomutase